MLFNVFLVIVVDNLVNVQILIEDEENEKWERELNCVCNKQRYIYKGKGWGKVGVKFFVVMVINYFVCKRNGNV